MSAINNHVIVFQKLIIYVIMERGDRKPTVLDGREIRDCGF